ncbi:hypothetical protein [Sphingorhabdus sp.]|uniref:hypothetical protein n=1 Tax=Sphingorhabdus sp. TaxID=1902408 RepID=UPI00391D01DA
MAEAVAVARVPFKQAGTPSVLEPKRTNDITLWDAMEEFGVGDKLLRQIADKGDCLVGRMRGETGIYLFDRVRLTEAVARYKTGIPLFDVSKELGAPGYTIKDFIENGLLETIPEHRLDEFSRDTLIEKGSVDVLFGALRKLPSFKIPTQQSLSLSDALSAVLSPFAWCDAFAMVLTGRIHAELATGQGSWASRLYVNKAEFKKLLSRVASRPLPSIGVPANSAASIVGVNDVVLGKAAKAGLIRRHKNGLDLPSLAAFRAEHAFPAEITKRLGISGRVLANTMLARVYEPIANLHKVNIWRRADIVEVFGESACEELPPV